MTTRLRQVPVTAHDLSFARALSGLNRPEPYAMRTLNVAIRALCAKGPDSAFDIGTTDFVVYAFQRQWIKRLGRDAYVVCVPVPDPAAVSERGGA